MWELIVLMEREMDIALSKKKEKLLKPLLCVPVCSMLIVPGSYFSIILYLAEHSDEWKIILAAMCILPCIILTVGTWINHFQVYKNYRNGVNK